jgi:hypothetical protein
MQAQRPGHESPKGMLAIRRAASRYSVSIIIKVSRRRGRSGDYLIATTTGLAAGINLMPTLHVATVSVASSPSRAGAGGAVGAAAA